MTCVLFFLLLFVHLSSPVKHSLKYFFTASSGIPNFPEYAVAVLVDDVLVGYCDNNIKTVEIKHDWVNALFKKEPHHLMLYRQECFENGPNYFRNTLNTLNQRYNQTGGGHVLQRMNGCEWDDETNVKKGFNQYGYDGEDLISFDMDTFTWVTPQSKAVSTKDKWNADRPRIKHNEKFLTQTLPGWLEKYVDYGKSTLLRRELPSMFLLQKTPSSPVTCHATGFYPRGATLTWRKDEKMLREKVVHREILPNHDDTFQMSVDLKLSSVAPEDWTRYDCVFKLSGVEDGVIIIRLDKDKIITNWKDANANVVLIVAGVVVIAILIVAFGLLYLLYKRRKVQPKTNQQDSNTPHLKVPTNHQQPLLKTP
ncbi:major histocompatibility complex class I-related gene protein-like [Brachionichthys hirsutus]|uniref:major histocompatibility complex class I-related gene protein-like n=1 Tax=Brachionichthys hirsutus TaxID=412623 RepID=UPI003604A9BF